MVEEEAYSCPILILYHRWVKNFKFWVGIGIGILGWDFGFGILGLEFWVWDFGFVKRILGLGFWVWNFGFVKRMYQVGGVHDSCVPACRKTRPVKGKGKGKGKGKPAPRQGAEKSFLKNRKKVVDNSNLVC